VEKSTDQDKNAPTIGKALSRREFLERRALAGVGASASGVGVGRAMVAHTGAPKHGAYPDAITNDALDGLNSFVAWLGTNQGYVRQIGVPSNLGPERRPFYPDQKQWRALGEAWFAQADASRLWVTVHDCSEYQLWGGYYASLYVSNGDGKTAL
jgi:hypothetical protein